MYITNIRQRNLSTNKGYRATFTKAQVGRDGGGEPKQANMAACNRFPYTHNAPDSKECFYLVGPHTGQSGTRVHHGRVANFFFLLGWLISLFLSFLLGALSQPFQSAMGSAAGNEICSDNNNSCQFLWSQWWTVSTPTDVLSGSERYGLVQLCPLRLYTVLEWVCVFSMLVAIAWVVSASPQHRPVGGLVWPLEHQGTACPQQHGQQQQCWGAPWGCSLAGVGATAAGLFTTELLTKDAGIGGWAQAAHIVVAGPSILAV